MSEEMKKVSEEELEQATGGYGANGWRTVTGLKSGWLAMRTAPTYDYNNEMRGHELYNGDQVQITGAFVQGYDGRTYVWVYSPKTGASGYVNAAYLG